MSAAHRYPNDFLGRCQTCLDNAYLSSAPCQIGYGNGMPLNDDACAIRHGRRMYDDLERKPQRAGGEQARTTENEQK